MSLFSTVDDTPFDRTLTACAGASGIASMVIAVGLLREWGFKTYGPIAAVSALTTASVLFCEGPRASKTAARTDQIGKQSLSSSSSLSSNSLMLSSLSTTSSEEPEVSQKTALWNAVSLWKSKRGDKQAMRIRALSSADQSLLLTDLDGQCARPELIAELFADDPKALGFFLKELPGDQERARLAKLLVQKGQLIAELEDVLLELATPRQLAEALSAALKHGPGVDFATRCLQRTDDPQRLFRVTRATSDKALKKLAIPRLTQLLGTSGFRFTTLKDTDLADLIEYDAVGLARHIPLGQVLWLFTTPNSDSGWAGLARHYIEESEDLSRILVDDLGDEGALTKRLMNWRHLLEIMASSDSASEQPFSAVRTSDVSLFLPLLEVLGPQIPGPFTGQDALGATKEGRGHDVLCNLLLEEPRVAKSALPQGPILPGSQLQQPMYGAFIQEIFPSWGSDSFHPKQAEHASRLAMVLATLTPSSLYEELIQTDILEPDALMRVVLYANGDRLPDERILQSLAAKLKPAEYRAFLQSLIAQGVPVGQLYLAQKELRGSPVDADDLCSRPQQFVELWADPAVGTKLSSPVKVKGLSKLKRHSCEGDLTAFSRRLEGHEDCEALLEPVALAFSSEKLRSLAQTAPSLPPWVETLADALEQTDAVEALESVKNEPIAVIRLVMDRPEVLAHAIELLQAEEDKLHLLGQLVSDDKSIKQILRLLEPGDEVAPALKAYVIGLKDQVSFRRARRILKGAGFSETQLRRLRLGDLSLGEPSPAAALGLEGL